MFVCAAEVNSEDTNVELKNVQNLHENVTQSNLVIL